MLRSHGVTVETGMEVEEILSDREWVIGVRLKSGQVVSCERVIQAVGVRPNVGFPERFRHRRCREESLSIRTWRRI